MNDTHEKPSITLWVMVSIVVAGGVAWSAYLISDLTWDVELAVGIALLSSMVLLAGSFPIPVAPKVKAGMTTAPLFAAALVLGPGCAVIAAVVAGWRIRLCCGSGPHMCGCPGTR